MSDASSAAPSPVVDLVDDGMTEEIASRTRAWLDEVIAAEPVDIGVSAADLLDQMYADGEM